MADVSKRHSIAGKVATPKTAPTSSPAAAAATANAPQAMSEALESLSKAIGARIKLTTATQTYEGTLFTADPIINIVVINTLAPNLNTTATQNGNYQIIPISRVQNFSITRATEGNAAQGLAATQPNIGAVDMKQAKQREEARIAKLQEEERHRGKGVTSEAQALYDSFKRINMPIRWHNQEMIVHEAVIIPPPYRVEDCRAGNDKQEVLIRVRKVLEGERKKLRDKEEREKANARSATTSADLRKGG